MLENLAKLWAAVQDNVVFLLMCLGIFAGIFAAALAVEKLWLKPEKQSPARRAAYVGIFAAIAALLMYIEFPLPFAPGFYELDFSEIPVLICSFSLGPVAGVVCEFIKELLKLFLKTWLILWWGAPSFSPPRWCILPRRPRPAPSSAWGLAPP